MAKNEYKVMLGTHGMNGKILKTDSTIVLDDSFEKTDVFKKFFKRVGSVSENLDKGDKGGDPDKGDESDKGDEPDKGDESDKGDEPADDALVLDDALDVPKKSKKSAKRK